MLGTIIGGLITYFTQRSQKTEERANEIRTTAHGIGAELRAFVDLVSMRNHDAAVQRVISFIQSGQDVPLAQLAAGTGNPRDYFPIFYSRLNSLGSLDEEIADLAKFHTQLAGIYATLARLQTGTFDNAAADAKVEVLQTELALWRDTLVVGRAVATRLLGRA